MVFVSFCCTLLAFPLVLQYTPISSQSLQLRDPHYPNQPALDARGQGHSTRILRLPDFPPPATQLNPHHIILISSHRTTQHLTTARNIPLIYAHLHLSSTRLPSLNFRPSVRAPSSNNLPVPALLPFFPRFYSYVSFLPSLSVFFSLSLGSDNRPSTKHNDLIDNRQ